ncbi:MAG: phosphopantetheine-binding protein [Candidatus Vecturithrix sp.]|nr:phosphopantetheine-binding protein [Candidatus Vecturithrix sp.]
MTHLEQDIRDRLIDALELMIDPAEFHADTPLFQEDGGLGLDSLEALEIVTSLSNAYKINFEGAEKKDFQTIATLAQFVAARRDG